MSASCSRTAAGSVLHGLPEGLLRPSRLPMLPIRNSRRVIAVSSSGQTSFGIPAPSLVASRTASDVSCSAAASAAFGPAPESSNLSGIASGPLQPTATLVAAIVKFVLTVAAKARSAVTAAFPQLADMKPEDVRRHMIELKQLTSNIRLLAFVVPFAKAAASESLTAVYTRTFERAAFGFAKMYLFCLFMRVLLSWFPSIDWNAQPWTFLRLITEPYLQIYRGILPPLFGQLDFTPLFGFLILQDVVEVMAPTYTMGMHAGDTSTRWTTSDVMCYFDGF